MPAASLAALLDFESAFEAATQATLATSGINAFISQQERKLPTIDAVISFDCGAAYDELTLLPQGGQAVQQEQDFFRYNGVLTIEVSVRRDNDADPTQSGAVSFIGQMRGLVRGAFMQSQWPFDDTNLPYYRVSQIRPSGTFTGYELQRNVDLVSMKFSIDFAIQPTAWPTGFPPS